jgi:ankyrin repeat protein
MLTKIKNLIKYSVDIYIGGNRALISSISNSYLDVVKYLVEHGADIHADDNYDLRYSAKQPNRKQDL